MVRTAQPEAGTEKAPSPVRQRILAAADELFYAEGIRAVSADRIIAEAGVSKMTFYRHFPAKDDLVLAYVRGRVALERDALESGRRGMDAARVLTLMAETIAEISCAPGFRGCPYINAAAEYTDPDHPVRQAVAAHREWFRGVLAELLGELGVRDVPATVTQLMMLRDGSMVAGYLDGTRVRAETLIAAGTAMVSAAR